MAVFSFSFVQDCSWWPHVVRSLSRSRPYSDRTLEWRSSWQFSNFLSRFFPAQLYANWSVSSLLWTQWSKSSGSFPGFSMVRSWWAFCQQISQPASWGVSDCHVRSPLAAQIVYTSGSSTYCGKTSLSHPNWIAFIFELQFWPFYDQRCLLTFTRESSKPYILTHKNRLRLWNMSVQNLPIDFDLCRTQLSNIDEDLFTSCMGSLIKVSRFVHTCFGTVRGVFTGAPMTITLIFCH